MRDPNAPLLIASLTTMFVFALLFGVVTAARRFVDGQLCMCGHKDRDHDMTWAATVSASPMADVGKCKVCACRSFHRDYSW